MAELLGSGGRAVEKSWVARDTSDSPRPKSGDRVPLLGSLNAGPGEDGGLGARARGLGKRLTESGLPVREHWAMLAVLVLLTVGDTVFGAVLFFYYGSVYANCVSPPDLCYPCVESDPRPIWQHSLSTTDVGTPMLTAECGMIPYFVTAPAHPPPQHAYLSVLQISTKPPAPSTYSSLPSTDVSKPKSPQKHKTKHKTQKHQPLRAQCPPPQVDIWAQHVGIIPPHPPIPPSQVDRALTSTPSLATTHPCLFTPPPPSPAQIPSLRPDSPFRGRGARGLRGSAGGRYPGGRDRGRRSLDLWQALCADLGTDHHRVPQRHRQFLPSHRPGPHPR